MEIENSSTGRCITISKVTCIGAILILGLMFNVQFLAGMVDIPSEKVLYDGALGRNFFGLQDGMSGSPEQEFYGYTPVPAHDALEIHASDNPAFWYKAVSPYYKVYFKGNTVRMDINNAWIEYELGEVHGVVQEQEGCLVSTEESRMPDIKESVVDQNELSISNVFESVDVSYMVDTSVLTEELVFKEPKQVTRVIQRIQWEGMTPEYQDDGSILFVDENGDEIVKILAPYMEDASHNVCKDLHYEIVETESGYELHKVIDEKGLEWLKNAVYPVVLDPSMQTFEDAWEGSGLTPYGQYFKNLKEYVNPSNGLLTITQTDLTIPGRGLDLKLARTYITPAVFYGSDPYDYEAPPVDVGKGWQLDFPYVGSKYLHLWGGTVYKIEWSGNIFTNHAGSHFTLVKNGDSTYTLTMASGTVYEFNTDGYLIHMKDLDQNTITFSYASEELTITDTIGRTISLVYSNGRLWKIVYNNEEIEFSYDGNGCLQWMKDFLGRKTSYYYNSGYNNWLLSKIEYPTSGYTTYHYSWFSDSDYYKYHVTNQKVYETNQVRHAVYTYTGSFSQITSSETAIKNESDVVKGYYSFSINSNNLVTERKVKNASGTPIKKYTFAYNSNKQVTQINVYNDGSNLSYTMYYGYDNWGNVIYYKNAQGHEQFFSYANTNTSGFFVDNNNSIIKTFTNAFSNNTVPASVHTAILGAVEKQDATSVREAYVTYDSEAHPTQAKASFGNYTTWKTYSGTFNEYTGDTSFSIDLTGHTVAGNGVLKISGEPSTPTYQESHSHTPSYPGCGVHETTWDPCYGWISSYFKVTYLYVCGRCPMDCQIYQDTVSIGPFTHRPGTLGYQSYSTNPACGQKGDTFTVTTNWKAYPTQVKYNIDNSEWTTVSSNLSNGTAKITCPISDGTHTLYFTESSSKKTKFSWELYVPVDNTPDSYTTSMQYDTYGNITTMTDAESNTVNFAYSSDYSHAYLTEISATVGSDTITTKATYDYYRGWITSIPEPKGVDAGSGYDYLYTYDLLGRVTKKEFPLLSGQSERSYLQAVYDDTNRTVTIIDQLQHYGMYEYDKLGRVTDINVYTGEYGSGTLYATTSYTYRYDNKVKTVTDPGSDIYTYSYDFLGRKTQIQYPDSSTVIYSYDDTNHNVTVTNGRGYDTIYWFDWVKRLTKVEEEYESGVFAQTVYQYDEIGNLTSFTDAETHTTMYEYASMFGLTKTVYPDSQYEEYTYDDMGNVVLLTDCNGNQTTYTYDSIYRLTQIQYQDSSTVSFTYDLNNNRTRMDDNAPNTGDYVAYEYDTWNRLTNKTRYIGQDTYTVSYQYDIANRLTELTYPDNTQILYTYDDLNRTTEIKRYVDGSNDEILLDNVQYDTESLLTQFDYGNDLTATFSYDSRDRLTALDVKDGQTSYLDLDYAYDNNSNITQLVNGWRDTSSVWHSDTESYSYDGLDRLTSASCTSWSHTYSYDKVGNRTSKDGVTYTVNSVNEVTALSDGTSFAYDDNGNRTQKTKGTDTWEYIYDYANRLKKVEENDSIIGEYVYDGDGKRIQVTENNETTTYIYSGLNIVYEETMTGTAVYIYGPTGRIAKRTTINQETNTFYYHTDHLGSTRLVIDSSKNIVSAAAYHPFGETSAQEGSEDYLFNGKEMDSADFYYYGARYYDPNLGKFLTKDAFRGRLKTPQSLNRYAYCLNNPLAYVDAFGLVYYNVTDADGNEYTVRVLDNGTIFIGMEIDGIQYTWKISNDYKDWDLFWEDEEGFQELNLMKDGKITSVEGKAFYLGFCFWGALGGIEEPMGGYESQLEYAKAQFGEENAETFSKFYDIGKKFGEFVAWKDNELYRIYCPAPFNGIAWKNMVNKMAVELVFSYPWNPFPMVRFWKWVAAETVIRAIEKILYPEED
ncbi:MAG: RHS repeat-associated core domain-containing protein [Candidatus Methanofastidiosia archaeon]